MMPAGAPTRHDVDELFSLTCAAAIDSDVLVVCNPFPGDALPTELYADLVSDVSTNGTPVLVDLSAQAEQRARGPTGPREAERLGARGVRRRPGRFHRPARVGGRAADRVTERTAAIVTRGGESAVALRDGEVLELFPPRFERGSREGCGDSMMGALAAAWAQGLGWERSLVLGVAAGATNFLRHGLGTGSRAVIEEMAARVIVERRSA